MKVTYNWLKDFVEIRISPQALAKRLTLAGLEVTSLEKKDGDFVLEMEITSNRPDCLSVMGIAREVAAITDKKLKLLQALGFRLQAKNLQRAVCSVQQFAIEIEAKKDCPLYTAKLIKDVQVAPSPDWLKARLELVGCRSVNNIVDITNYILFTWGQPLHTFDLDKLSPEAIVVRRGKPGEKIITIDGQERILESDILVIADRDKPIAIAGIMGGQDTEVNEKTKNILLESAIFNPLIVRRARQRLALQSESAYRFERGIDLEIVEKASGSAAALIQEFSGGKYILAKSSRPPKTKQKKINLNLLTLNKILGVKVAVPKAKQILNSLGFKVNFKAKNNLAVNIPSHRQDVNLEVDLIEEIARIYGYAEIPKTLPKITPQLTVASSRGAISLLKNILLGLGLNEVITYSLINKALLKDLEIETAYSTIEILNPLSKEQEILRPTLIPSLLGCIATNLNQKQDRINLFEIAKVFSMLSGNPTEKLVLGIALCGTKPLETGFLHLKGILEVIFARLGIKEYNFKMLNNTSSIAVDVREEKIGLMARLQGNILERFDIKNKDIFVAELSLDNLLSYANLKKRFSPLPIYPGILRDISLILKENITVDNILKTIKEKGALLLQDVRVVDYYKGKQIPAGFKGLTISCLYRLDARTLTEAEIEPLHSQICATLTKRFSAKIR